MVSRRVQSGAKISARDPREWERRQLLDTYKTFGCESGTPTFRYSLIDGVKEGYLLNPIVVDARTEITTELLAEQGCAVMVENQDGDLEEQTFSAKTLKGNSSPMKPTASSAKLF